MKELEFEITKKDCINYVKDVFKIPKIRKHFKSSLLALLIISLCGGLFVSSIFFSIDYNIYLFIIATLIFGGSIFAFLYKCFIFERGKASYKMLKGTDLKLKMTFDENGIINISSTANSTFNWKGIVGIYNCKHTIIIFVGDVQGMIIPKRIFSSELEATKFYAQLLEYYNNAKNS